MLMRTLISLAAAAMLFIAFDSGAQNIKDSRTETVISIHGRQVDDTFSSSVSDTLASRVMSGPDSSRLEPVPHPIPNFLPPDRFIPADRLIGFQPWTFAPLPRPVIHVIPVHGFNGSIGFGEYSIFAPDKFFSTLAGYNSIDIPQMYLTQQMMVGNTLKLGRKVYFLSGILYGAQLGVLGNNWGMGTREGFILHPSSITTITFWTQYFQAISVYSPVIYPDATGDGAAIIMPGTPEVFSFGVQATFRAGDFIIGIGTSVRGPSKRHSYR